jgi:hypothetical protein
MFSSQAVAGVLEISETEISSMFKTAIDQENENAIKYFAWAVVDNDNQHGSNLFLAVVALYAGLFMTQDRTWVFGALMIPHVCIVVNHTFALSGNYYVDLPDGSTEVFVPARILHSFLLVCNLFFFVSGMCEGNKVKTS